MSFEALCERAESERDAVGVPGVAVGVVAGGEEHAAGFGVTSVENPVDTTPDTVFQIGSITKTFVAAAVMRLVDDGRLALDEPVRRWLPELALADEDVAERVTLRHLLTHTGGWVGDYFDDFGRGGDALARMVDRLVHLEQQTPLGEISVYNNSGFYVLGRALEVVTGLTFEEALRDVVLVPLGLERAFFFAEDVITERFAVGHEPAAEGGGLAVARPWAIGRAAHAAGGIVTSVRELLRYGRFAFDGQPLLSRESWAESIRPQAFVGGDVDAVGLAWHLRKVDETRLIFHGGGTKGQISVLVVAPEDRFAFACLTNHSYGGLLTDRLSDAALELFLGVRREKPSPRDLAAEDLREFARSYRGPMADVELEVAGGGLELRMSPRGGFPTPDTPPPPAPPPAQIGFYADDWAIATDELWDGTHVGFLRGGDGRIVWMRLGGRLYAPA